MTKLPDDEFDYVSLDHAAGPMFGAQEPGPHVLRTHPVSVCINDPNCCIHNPSHHPLEHAKMNWRGDRGLMERICEHGIGHPDPDDIAHKRRTMGDEYAGAQAVHGCDGCCRAS